MLGKYFSTLLTSAGGQSFGIRCLSTSRAVYYERYKAQWKVDRNRPMHNNQVKEIRDDPDFTYLDGRPAPYGGGQMKRIRIQRQMAETIVKYSKELDAVKEESKNLKERKEKWTQDKLNSKLKPKGDLLLQKSEP